MPGLTSLLLVSIAATPATLPLGTQLTYRGTMIAEKGDPADTTKSFELNYLVSESNAEGVTLCWTLREQGRGSGPWTSHFGIWQVADETIHPAGGPALLYQREQGASVVPLRLPRLIPPGVAAKGSRWKQGDDEYLIAAAENRREQNCWRIEVTSPYRGNRTIWVREDSFLVVERVESVVIGQGEQHEVRISLERSSVLPAEQVGTIAAGFESLAGLRQRLGIEPAQQAVSLERGQLDLLNDELQAVAKVTSGSFLAAIVTEAQQDTGEQKNRSGAVHALAKMAIGKPAPRFSLKSTTGEEVSSDQFKDSVTVLHFWGYRDAPLIEPYGQIGYLDFLYRNRKDSKVNLYGVAVDERLAEPETQGRAVAGVRKLKSFMNLSYPILLDDGGTLKKFGDPRVAGAKLPLFVVMDTSGKIVHYHVGDYEVDRRLGLKQLDEVIQKHVQSGE